MLIAKKTMRWFFRTAKQSLKSNDRLRSLIYDESNIAQFADLDYQEAMLADKVRLDAYHEAIRRTVKPGDVVIDLGTGTGILAMFAARSGARKVYALEHGEVIEIAKQVASHNKLTNIEFVRKNSRDFKAPELADLVIHEQIGSYLFDENMVENLLDIKARMLKPGGKILPAKFQFFVEPISLRDDHRVPYCWESQIKGIDYSCLKNESTDRKYRQGSGRRFMQTGSIDRYACEPAPLFEFDLNDMISGNTIPTSYKVQKAVVRDGRVDGLSVFFRVIFDEELSFDNALDSRNTSWTNPLFRIPARDVRQGDRLTLSIDMSNILDYTTWKMDLS